MRKASTALTFFIAILASIVPVFRAAYLLEINYNEGWNVYNADRVAYGLPLYGARYGWISNNYPMLSFGLLAGLHRWTHDYLFTGRILSLVGLLGSAVAVAGILRSLGLSRWSAWLAGLFCWTSFCALAIDYVGADDPQLLAQAVVLLGLLVYVRHRQSRFGLLVTALLFVTGLNIKHNLIDIPVAVFLDLALSSLSLAVWFAIGSLSLLALSVWGTLHFGGPFFFAQLFVPRRYFPAKVPLQILGLLGPLLVPLALGMCAASRQRTPSRRLVWLLFGAALVIGGYFSGGSGVGPNSLFTALVCVAFFVGLFLERPALGKYAHLVPQLRAASLAACFIWLLIPLALSGNWNPVARWKTFSARQSAFAFDVSFLRSQPGPALCESLLMCYAAGKPFLYDPFNATRLLWFHKLNPTEITGALQSGRFGVVQTDAPLEWNDPLQAERFAPSLQSAIADSYTRAHFSPANELLQKEAGENTTFYLSRNHLAERPLR